MDLPDIGFGTYGLRDEACRQAVETALETGYRFVDTAQMYANEEAVGDAVAASDVAREDVVVATKVWHDKLAHDDVLASTRRSRERLGVDAIDLLYVHWPRGSYDPEGTLSAFDELYDEGVVRNVGLSNFTTEQLDEAQDLLSAPVVAHQVECHPMLPQEALRGYAERHGHRLVAYSPLAKGRVGEIPEVRDIAETYDATPAQVALAWHRAHGVVPIPKSGTPAHIRENYASLDLDLDDADVAALDAVDRRERLIDPADAAWNR